MKIAYNLPGHVYTVPALHDDLLLDANRRMVLARGHWMDKARQVKAILIDPDNISSEATTYGPTNKNDLDAYTEPGTFWTIVYKQNYYIRTVNGTVKSASENNIPSSKTGELFVGALSSITEGGSVNSSGVSVDSATYVYQRYTTVDGHTYVRYKGTSGWSDWENCDDTVRQVVTTTTNTDKRPLIIGASYSSATTPTFSTVTDQVLASHNMYVIPSTGELIVLKITAGTATFTILNGTAVSNYLTTTSSLNASNLTGTIDTARLPSTVVLTNTTQTITGAKTFTGSTSLEDVTINGNLTVTGRTASVNGLTASNTVQATAFQIGNSANANQLLVNGGTAPIPSTVGTILQYTSSGLAWVIPSGLTANKVGHVIKFTNTSNSVVQYDGSAEIDLTAGVNYSAMSGIASKLGTSNVGSASKPIYLVAGVATESTYDLSTISSRISTIETLIANSDSNKIDALQEVYDFLNGVALNLTINNTFVTLSTTQTITADKTFSSAVSINNLTVTTSLSTPLLTINGVNVLQSLYELSAEISSVATKDSFISLTTENLNADSIGVATITVTQVASDLLPSITSTSTSTGFSLGNSSYKWNYIYAREFVGNLNGKATGLNVSSNGVVTTTNSNGTISIVAANTLDVRSATIWTTARNFIIGSKTISVNGSTDYTWSLSDIGAEPTQSVITKSVTIPANTASDTWVDGTSTAITTSGFVKGSYLVQIEGPTNAANYSSTLVAGMAGCLFTGVMSICPGTVAYDDRADEVVLHRAGKYNDNTLYMRTVSSATGETKIQFAVAKLYNVAIPLTVKFKKLL